MNKLLILDGNSVLHRAYYALPDWRNRSGEATAGVYGFLSMMLSVIGELKPTHVVITFDDPSPTFRHNMYIGYQSNREKERQIDEDIWGQVEKLKIVFAKIGIPVFQTAGFEADDLIGTLAKQAKCDVMIITGDRDLMQLVDEKVNLYMPIKGMSDMQMIDKDKVKDKLGVWPEQVIDYKALVGDSSDNYPGVVGIGPKTAVQLIEEFGSFEKIVAQIPNPKSQIPNNIKIKISNGYEGGELSKRLATIKTDVPVSFDSAQSTVPSPQKITEVLQELGYKSLVKRMGPARNAAHSAAGGGKENEDSSRPRLFE